MTPAVLILTTLEKVLDVLTTPEASGGCPLDTQPCRVALYPGGEAAFDTCEESACSDGNGQLWANLQPFTLTTDAGGNCQIIRYTAEIGIIRCAAKPGNDGTPPSAAAVANDAWQQALDADQIQSAITCCDTLTPDDRDKLTLTAWRPVIEGGCVGGIWTVTGVLNMCC